MHDRKQGAASQSGMRMWVGVPGSLAEAPIWFAASAPERTRKLEERSHPQISTGDLFRYNLKNQTELGVLAKSYMERGELVPDEVTIRMVEDRLLRDDCQAGAIFDGFPRNLQQAVALDELTAAARGCAPGADDPLGRRARQCAESPDGGFVAPVARCTMSTLSPAKVAGVCDLDGGELYQRDDDTPDTVRNRLYVYYKQTSPLVGYYLRQGRCWPKSMVLSRLNGCRPVAWKLVDAESSVHGRSDLCLRIGRLCFAETAAQFRRSANRRCSRATADAQKPARDPDHARGRAHRRARCTECDAGDGATGRQHMGTGPGWRWRCCRSTTPTSAFLGYRGYPAHICTSINEELVHGIPSKDRVLQRRRHHQHRCGQPSPRLCRRQRLDLCRGRDRVKRPPSCWQVTEASLMAGIEQMVVG